MPTLIENRPVKTTLPLPSGSHGFGLKILDDHSAEPICKLAARSVMPVGADTGATGCKFGDTLAGFGVPLRAPFTTRYGALCKSLTTLKRLKAGRNRNQFSCAQGKRIRHSAINTNGGRDVGRGLVLDLKREGNVPAIRRKADSRVHGLALERARVSVANPADLRNEDFRPPCVQPTCSHLPTAKPERVMGTALARGWVAGNTRKPTLIGPVKVAKSLLLACTANRSNPVVFRTKLRQLPALAGKADVPAGSFLKPLPVVPPLFEREIVDETAHSGELPEERFLFGGRSQPVAIAAVNHKQILPSDASCRNSEKG